MASMFRKGCRNSVISKTARAGIFDNREVKRTMKICLVRSLTQQMWCTKLRYLWHKTKNETALMPKARCITRYLKICIIQSIALWSLNLCSHFYPLWCHSLSNYFNATIKKKKSVKTMTHSVKRFVYHGWAQIFLMRKPVCLLHYLMNQFILHKMPAAKWQGCYSLV